MPSILLHQTFASKLHTELGIKNQMDFFFGSVFPDINIERRDEFHYYMPWMLGDKYYHANPIPNISAYINNDFDGSDFHKGVLLHLVMDQVFNEYDNIRIGLDVFKLPEHIVVSEGKLKQQDIARVTEVVELIELKPTKALETYIKKYYDISAEDLERGINGFYDHIKSDGHPAMIYTTEVVDMLLSRVVQLYEYYLTGI